MDNVLPQSIQLQVVTPERLLVSEETTSVTLPGKSGFLGILPGHAPLVSELKAGVLSFEQNGSAQHLAISDGFTEVLPGRVIVLARTAERATDIDLARARAAKERAEEQLKRAADSFPEEERNEAQLAFERAQARLDAAGMGPSPGI